MDLNDVSPKPIAPLVQRSLSPGRAADPDAKLHESARAFEATFIAEMLKYTGINKTPESTGGGAGEDAFASFLTEEYAKRLSERGGFGLAEQIFNALKSRESA